MKPINNKRRTVDYNEFRWLLSSYGLIAGFYNSLGLHQLCEQVYVKYISYLEDFYLKDSLEVANAYF